MVLFFLNLNPYHTTVIGTQYCIKHNHLLNELINQIGATWNDAGPFSKVKILHGNFKLPLSLKFSVY